MSRQLDLLVDKEDLRILVAAQQRVTLAKAVNGGGPAVVWVTFNPLESMTAKWSEDYSIYASTTDIHKGAHIYKLAEINPGPAQTGGYYPFTPAATFGDFQQSASVSATGYAAYNNMPYSQYQALTFGLSQSISVNNVLAERLPISAESTPSTFQADFSPDEGVYIWLQNEFRSGTVFKDPGQMLASTGRKVLIRFPGDNFVVTLKYNPNMGLFLPPGEDGSMLEDGHAEVHNPLIE